MEKYKNYKDSGIEWIGEIPEHWKLDKINRLFKINTGFTPATGNDDYYKNGEHDWITIRDLDGKYISDSKTKLTDLAVKGKTKTPKGSLLYSFKLSVGQMAFTTKDLYTNEAIFSIFPSDNINLNYYYYLLDRILIHNSNENIYGAKILNQELIKAAKLVIPPKNEQNQIANYLDHKTTQIDRLVDKKEQLIKLLQEERTAIINQAVTKGIPLSRSSSVVTEHSQIDAELRSSSGVEMGLSDTVSEHSQSKVEMGSSSVVTEPSRSGVEMKDSGIEWLGKIPKHWEVWKISHAFKNIGSGTTPESGNSLYHENGTVNWLNTGDLNDDVLYNCGKKVTKKAIQDYSSLKLFPSGSLVMAMYGATIGKTAIVHFETTTNQACCVFCKSDIINLKYLQYWFKAKKEYIINLSIGGGQPNISQHILKNIRLACPNITEQKQIINFIEREEIRINTIITKTQQEISLLKEYKTALISEVVTGKVDIRNVVLN